MSIEVFETARASQQVATLDGRHRKTYRSFLDELTASGCRALAYRLTGALLDHLCVKHLRGNLRVVVGFSDVRRAWILLVGPHDMSDPGIDVYRALYAIAGHEPEPEARRTKPPCCLPDGTAPSSSAADQLADRAVAIRQTRAGRKRRT